MMRQRNAPSPLTRRDFVKLGATAAAISTLRRPTRAADAAADLPFPPHRALEVPGMHVYPSEHSIAAGQTAGFHVSASVPYRMSICRLGWDADSPAMDEVLHEFPLAPANPQPIHPGSCVHVEDRLRGPLRAITLECWVRPWDVTRLQGLITQEDKDSSEGLALGIDKDGIVEFHLGDGMSPEEAVRHRTKSGAVARSRWQHVVATWDGSRKRVFVDAREIGAWDFAGPLAPGEHPLRLGALAQGGRAQHFLDGDLAMPVICGHPLSEEEIRARFAQKGLEPASGKGVLACWPLTEERGAEVADQSGHRRHGRILNHATWMIGGPSFRTEVPRFAGYDPKSDPTRGHGLRFAADDLFDCRWSVTHRWNVPAGAKPGVYVARVAFDFEDKPRLYHCTFIVRRAERRPRAPLLVLAAANTWRAYSGSHFAVAPPELKQVWGTGGLKDAAPGLPAFNLYRAHAGTQGTYQVGLRMPWPAAGPYVLYGGPTSYSHLMRAERFTHIWLEQQGYAYDLVSDVDLHRDPSLLRGYRAVIIAGHNEYWSSEMFGGLESYLRAGGNVVCLSGNSLFWRVSFNDDCSVMECRKVDAPGMQVPAARRGEAWHSHDGRRGGMMRECGWPGWQLIGLDSLGWNNPGKADNFGPYTVEDPDHFLFNQPEKLGLEKGHQFGRGPNGGMPLANGHEFDVRPSTLARLQEQPPPAGGSVPADPPNIQLLANGIVPWKNGGSAFDYFFRKITPKTDQGGEMIYWERPAGGRVFNAGAIGSGWTLGADPAMAGLLRNVLAHFGVMKGNA